MKSEAYYINELKIGCKQFLGRDIRTNTDAKVVLDIINANAKNEISFSTLRRFFGFLKSTKPSRKTLNIISESLGHNSFSQFCNKYNAINNWTYVNCLVKSRELSSMSTKDRNMLVEFNNQGASMMGIFLFFLMEDNAFEKMDAILSDANVLPEKISEVGEIAELLSISMRKKNKAELNQLSEFLNKNVVFKELCLYLSVDYESFSGAYMYLLNKTNKHQKLDKQERLFTQLINNSFAFFNKRKMEPLKKEYFKMHPVLYGRYVGQLILQHNDSSLLFEILKDDLAHEFFLEIFPALILTKDFESISKIENQYYEKILTPTDYTYEDKKTIALIAFAINNFKQKNYTAAEVNLSFIDYNGIINSYRKFFELLGTIPSYHLAKHHNSSKKNKLKNQYLNLSKTLGFPLFDASFLENYF